MNYDIPVVKILDEDGKKQNKQMDTVTCQIVIYCNSIKSDSNSTPKG